MRVNLLSLMLCLSTLLSCDFKSKFNERKKFQPPSFVAELFQYAQRKTVALTDDQQNLCNDTLENYNDATMATQTELNKCVFSINDSLCTQADDGKMHMRGKLALILATHSYEETVLCRLTSIAITSILPRKVIGRCTTGVARLVIHV